MKEIPILFSAPMVQAILAGRKTQTRRIINPQPIIDEESGFIFDGKHRRQYDIHNWKDKFIDDRSRWMPEDKLFVRENWRMKMWDFEESEVDIEFGDGEIQVFEAAYDKPYAWMVRQYEKLLFKEIIIPESDEEECRMVFTGKKHPFSPSIHLPKWCSRIWVEVKGIRVERLQDITEDDAIAEGIEGGNVLGLKTWTDYAGTTRRGFFIENSQYSYPDGKNPQAAAVASYCTLWHSINGKESWDANPWVWVIDFKVLSIAGKPDL